ncbi:MAG: glycosyltransferase family 39 protein [Solirubrobacterales bacterium]|nr:glycosyltransferase family 39 protein [Solirubrobacterales bacterium]MBV9473913.1 glycosyltransferase family 39 protein [Solirubrobacterales bacterium]
MLIPARTGAAAVARNDSAPLSAGISAEVWLLTGVTLLAAALRFATLTDQSYWFDEAQAAHELHLSFGAMLSAWSANEPNPPLYFVLAWPWAKLFGTGEAGLRSLSALLGTGVVPLAYLCGRELVSRRAGLAAAALAAINPFMIWYSQEAREYMLLAALAGASLLFFARAWQHPSRRNLVWWGVFSAAALLTQYFAGFLVAAEAIGLLYRARSRLAVVVVAAQGVVELALIPHLVSHASHPTGWIDQFPLSIRIEQVPVAFAINTLYRSSLVTYGLWGAAVLAGCLIVLLVIGADGAELRGAGLAAGLAGAVLLIPLALAVLGHDYYEARALMPAWIPLAVVIGAACAAPRLAAAGAGAVLALALAALFVYGAIRIQGSPPYQRPNWRGVAGALGAADTNRAIVAYDGTFASAPLAIYLPGVPWTGSGQTPQTGEAPVTVGEVDVVGSSWQTPAAKLPTGVRLLGSRTVDGYLAARFSLAPAWRASPAAIGARASQLLGPGPPGPAVLIQYRSA